MLKRKKLLHLNDDQLRENLYLMHYRDSMSVLAMSEELEVSRAAIYDWMEYFGISSRTSSEANIARYAKCSEDERKANIRKAQEARRGSKDTQESKEKRAQHHQLHRKMSKWETLFAKWLIDAGITGFTHEYAVGIFNIDFAFPEHKIAVEIDGGNWHSTPQKQAGDTIKENLLASEGWEVFRVSTAGWTSKDGTPTTYKRRASELIELLKGRVGR